MIGCSIEDEQRGIVVLSGDGGMDLHKVAEKPRVIWLSHLGRVIRASPEHVRPASLREYVNLPRDENGEVKDERPQGRGYV